MERGLRSPRLSPFLVVIPCRAQPSSFRCWADFGVMIVGYLIELAGGGVFVDYGVVMVAGVGFDGGGVIWVTAMAAVGLFHDSGGMSTRCCHWSFGLLARIDSAGALHRVIRRVYSS
ncbi:hypothetical protein GIB67_000287 [Kingdonia uniflora]|uniref:Uncharacterized protein n=1 Tax=Kingdonia uniflora TaxID=39325 RepID=A0A7J7LCH0_9MAGN|nr:hypothetical protein GIB67_000287 [Kingdonia uniflora]